MKSKMNSIEKKAVLGISIFIVLFILSILFYRKFYLKNHHNTFAIYMGTEGSAWGRTRIIKFKTQNGIFVKAEVNYENNLNIGDTVWIKYSIEKPEIAEIIDRDYKKYLKKGRGDVPDGNVSD